MKYTTIIAIDPDTEKSGVAMLDLRRAERLWRCSHTGA